jgi:hypothetical protein
MTMFPEWVLFLSFGEVSVVQFLFSHVLFNYLLIPYLTVFSVTQAVGQMISLLVSKR